MDLKKLSGSLLCLSGFCQSFHGWFVCVSATAPSSPPLDYKEMSRFRCQKLHSKLLSILNEFVRYTITMWDRTVLDEQNEFGMTACRQSIAVEVEVHV